MTHVEELSAHRRVARYVRRKLRSTFGPSRLRRAASAPMIRLVLGASRVSQPGWTATDIEYLDITLESDWARHFMPATISAMLSEHVWEHLAPIGAETAAQLCRRYLRPGGYLRVAVPDGLHPDPEYIQHVKPGGTGPGAKDHKSLFTYRTFSNLFENAGFTVNLLEYFDEHGQFHFREWSRADGMIHRSKRFDERNGEDRLNYTSLILDAKVGH